MYFLQLLFKLYLLHLNKRKEKFESTISSSELRKKKDLTCLVFYIIHLWEFRDNFRRAKG